VLSMLTMSKRFSPRCWMYDANSGSTLAPAIIRWSFRPLTGRSFTAPRSAYTCSVTST